METQLRQWLKSFLRNKIYSTLLALSLPFGALAGEPIVYEGQGIYAIVPECPLALGSLKIQSRRSSSSFTAWTSADDAESYQLIQKVIRCFRQKGSTDYLIYGKEDSTPFTWEIVPFPKESSRFWKQFSFLWNTTFGGPCLSDTTRNEIAKGFQDCHLQTEFIESEISENDPFCDPEVISKQMIYEGKLVRVLYNYAPIVLGERKLHFLIVPKAHRVKFLDLTHEEYLESMEILRKFISFYKIQGYPTVYIFDKSGAEAGQTVPHWHEHVIFTATKTEELFGRLVILKNMLIGASPLSDKELQERVLMLRSELCDLK